MKCQICGRNEATEATTFHYNKINCNCCENGHVQVVLHCEHCTPHLPNSIHPEMKDEISGENYSANINNILPDKIDGQFIIEEPVITNKVFKWHKCKNGLPIEGDEPEENIELLIVCRESHNKKIFYKTNLYNKKDWAAKYLMRYEVLGWTYIQEPSNYITE